MDRWIGWAASASLILSFGCADDACRAEPPSFQLDLTVEGRTGGSLVIELSNGSERRRRTFDLSGELDDGRTSIAVDVEESLVGEVTITARTHAGADGNGAVLGEATGSFPLAPNGCNRFELQLEGMMRPDAGEPEDAGESDAEPETDAGEDAGEDAGDPDTGTDAGPRCVEEADPSTIALYSMEGDLADTAGAHDGTVEGNATFEAGEPSCGDALRIPGAAVIQGYGQVPDSPAFDLAEGSLDLWLQIAATGRAAGIVSRDSSSPDATGLFTLYVSCDGTLVAKLDDVHLCSDEPVAVATWSHVGINFGPTGLEMFVDGAPATRTTPVGLFGGGCSQTVQCGGTSTTGLAGNDNPWIMGASADSSGEGMGNPLELPFRDGLIDAFRISDARRAF